MKKKLIVAVGGTGGHLYPAQAVAEELNDISEILFVGSGLDANRYFDSKRFDFRNVDSGSVSLKKPISSLMSSRKIVKGYTLSSKVIESFQPDAIIGFGSYHSLPPLLAAIKRKIPTVLHEANSIPGRVNRLLSPYVDLTAIHFPDSAKLLKGKTEIVCMPLRKKFRRSEDAAREAENYYRLDSRKLTLLIFGGSQGAQSINNTAFQTLIVHLAPRFQGLQVIHITGQVEGVHDMLVTYQKAGIDARVKAFEERMDLAWSLSDLVIGRAGASTLAEQIEFQVPGILIPYPYATDNHQEKNAESFILQTGGALLCPESILSAEQLSNWIQRLIQNDQALLRAMKQGIAQYKKTLHTRSLSQVIKELL